MSAGRKHFVEAYGRGQEGRRSGELVWGSRELLYIFHEFLLKLQVTQAAIR